MTFLDKHFGGIVKSEFHPPWWARNRHIQTIWPRFIQKRQQFTPRMERLSLPDGDFVDLAWSPIPEKVKGIVVLFHGLEGSVRSHYANDMMAEMTRRGWLNVLMHFRGCSGEANHTPRAYHSGDTGDALFFLEWLNQRFPGVGKMAIGYSLGANMLLKMLGETADKSILKSAVAVSPPLRLAECAASINRGFSRVYQRYLLGSMKRKLLQKMQVMDYREVLNIKPDQTDSISSFREFDQHITAPLHGFTDADDYYQRCSAYDFLSRIKTPTLLVHAADDPFMNHSVIPQQEHLSPYVRCEISEKGGHVGFIQGSPLKPVSWLNQRVADFVAQTFK